MIYVWRSSRHNLDGFGRRKVIFGAGLGNVVLGVVSAFSPSVTFLIVVRFCQGVLATGKDNTEYVLAMEYCGPSRRAAPGSIMFVCWALGYMGLAGVAYFVRQWRWLMLAVTLPELIYYILIFFFVPESPRWLYLKGRKEEADKIVHKMARINKKILPRDLTVSEKVIRSSSSPLDLVREPEIRSVTLILFIAWATCAFVYYGLSFASPGLEVNIYLSCVISGAIEIPAYVIFVAVANRTGRLAPFSGSLILAGITLFVTLCIPPDRIWLLLALGMLGKFFVTLAFTVVWAYSGEVYPTCVRNMGVTVTSTAARVASPLAPYVALLAAYHPVAPAVLFGALSLAAGLLTLRLPETRGQPMMQTIEEGERFMRDNRLSCRRRRKENSRHSQSEDKRNGSELEQLKQCQTA